MYHSATGNKKPDVGFLSFQQGVRIEQTKNGSIYFLLPCRIILNQVGAMVTAGSKIEK